MVTSNCLILKMALGSKHLVTRTTRAIMNHAPIGEYRLRFFPSEDFKYSCGNYSIESRRHILHDCTRFNGYWNPRRDSLCHFIMFLIANPRAFAFIDNPHSVASNWFWNDSYYFFYLFSLVSQLVHSVHFLIFFSLSFSISSCCLLLLYVVMK